MLFRSVNHAFENAVISLNVDQSHAENGTVGGDHGQVDAQGFIAIVLMAGIREKIEDNDIPESFKGTPIVLLTACLMAIAFFGFSGLK